MAKAKKETLSLEEFLEKAVVKEEDRPYEVPGNWVWTRLGYTAEIKGGKRLPSGHSLQEVKTDYPYIRVTDFIDTTIDIDNIKYIDKETFLMIKNYTISYDDIYISIAGTIGKVGIIPIELDGANLTENAAKITNLNGLIKKYLMFLLLSDQLQYQISGSTLATTQAKLALFRISEFSIPLPPLAEQQRIVEVIESLFEKLDTAKELVQNALDSFESRKAAILHKAFTGELTARWREKNATNKNDLLRDILTYYTESGVKKNFNNMLELQGKVTEIKSIENSLWYKCQIGAVSVVSNGSTPSRQKPEYWNGTISWVSSGEVRNNVIETTKETITQDGYDNSSVKMLPAGTVLIAMIGEGKTRGQSAILNIEATINQNIAAIDISHKKVEPKFMWYWLQKQYESNREKGNGTGPQALNCQRVRELDFVLPPLPEQREIVCILDNLLEKEQRAKELSDVIEKIDLMKKAVLARAFRGELGTNNLEEESAVELLKEVLKKKK